MKFNQFNQFNKNNDVLTSKEYIVQCFGFRLFVVDESMHQTLSIQNKVHIVIVICMKFYMNFDGMILTFYKWTCVVHCVHQDKCLKTLHYLNIKT